MKRFLLLLCLSFLACSENKEKVCYEYLFENAEEIADLHKYVKRINFYPLNDSIPLGIVSKALFTENKDLLLLDTDGQILFFTDSCKNVCFPILRGRASNEYISATDIALNGDDLIVLDGSDIRYQSLVDKNNYRSFPLSVDAPCDAIAPMGNSGVYVFSAYSKNFTDNKKSKDCLLYAVDSVGKVTGEYVQREDVTFTLFNISQTQGAHYYLRPQNARNVFYSLKESGIEPVFKIHFGKENIPERYYYAKADEDIGTYMTAPYYKLPLDLCETDKCYYLRCAGPAADDIAIIFNKDSKQGIRWKNYPNDGDMRILTSDGICFALIYTPIEERDEEASHGPLFNLLNFFSDSIQLQKERTYLVKIDFDV